ncbi:uncharacterized protein LOC116381541 [Anarrhichthys ocellatus]|uniref:uncharacterized protein LOC116381541 n=1 Tax=Anarrhichthys ocellatus TaxID=433405 RepID=UPI0012EDC128|nr:uncharacterized protein LOC116381541 [Anarrhichthys ocellatus]
MRGIQHLLLLAEFMLLARCQPQVSILPKLKQIFSGDLLFLRCDNSLSGSTVRWYFNDMEQPLTNETWKIGVATPKHSGSYQCKRNGAKSAGFPIDVLDYTPSASLTIKTGQPVMQKGGSVLLQLDNDDGLHGWKCWVYRGGLTKKIALRLRNDNARVIFQPSRLNDQETVFWCTDTKQLRSNQITIRTSEKATSLEMYPLPAVVGESLTLKCQVWGTNEISRTIFYKDNTVIRNGSSSIYEIPNVTESAKGSYKCDATFTYMKRTAGPPYQVVSDNQDVFVQAPTVKAVLSANVGMSCSCTPCPRNSTYHWYYKNNGQPWALMDSRHEFMMPKASGTYACRAVWAIGRSILSNAHFYQSPIKSILIGVVIVLVILGLAAVAVCVYYKKRNTNVTIYEDVALTTRDTGDDRYEVLHKGAQREGEYDTLHPEAPGRQKKEGEYEALKRGETEEGVYHTLGMVGAAGGQ